MFVYIANYVNITLNIDTFYSSICDLNIH